LGEPFGQTIHETFANPMSNTSQSTLTVSELRDKIFELEQKRAADLEALKRETHVLLNGLKPSTLIKNTLTETVQTPVVTKKLTGVAIGAASGFILKKIVIGASRNPIRKLVGTLLQIGASNFIAKNSDTIQSLGERAITPLINRFFKKSRRRGEPLEPLSDVP
jgi:hypothetical protein